MKEHVQSAPRVVMFNLGWLPGAEHIVTTKTETTLTAVQAAIELIVPGGFVSICVYPGHEEGSRKRAACAAGLGGQAVCSRVQCAASCVYQRTGRNAGADFDSEELSP